jgi:hypothetical protein
MANFACTPFEDFHVLWLDSCPQHDRRSVSGHRLPEQLLINSSSLSSMPFFVSVVDHHWLDEMTAGRAVGDSVIVDLKITSIAAMSTSGWVNWK